MGIQLALCYDIFHSNVSYSYKIEAVVELVPDVQTKDADSITQWSLNGSVKINRIDENFVAIQLNVEGAESKLALPFKLLSPIRKADSPSFQFHPLKFLEFNQKEEAWSSNIKRAVASLFQIEGNSESGAYVSQEFGLYGLCPMEYYVNFSEDLLISKIYDTDLCTFPGGIFTIRSNIPINFCEPESEF
jgi:Lipoprotein amino terminal region